MKITKSYLKQVIKEELQKESEQKFLSLGTIEPETEFKKQIEEILFILESQRSMALRASQARANRDTEEHLGKMATMIKEMKELLKKTK